MACCSAAGCVRGAYCRGLCRPHYRVFLSDRGEISTQHRRPKGLSVSEALARYTPTGLGRNECWPWPLSLNNRGYGQLRFEGGLVTAHRAAWEVANGRKLVAGEQVRHRCDNRKCVNPGHLETGSPADNSRDMVTRGRSRRGEKQNFSRLTEVAVREMRDLYADGARADDLAIRFDVSVQTVYHVLARRTWKHVR